MTFDRLYNLINENKKANAIKELKLLANLFNCEIEDDKDNTTLYIHAPEGKGWEYGTLSTLCHGYGQHGIFLPQWRQEAIQDALERLKEYGKPTDDVTEESCSINEKIDYDKGKQIIIDKGEELWHGTIEKFDSRKLKVGGDGIFWTADDVNIARSYIPLAGGYTTISISHLANNEEYAKMRDQLGLTNKIKTFAYNIQSKGYEKCKNLESKLQKYKAKHDETEKHNTSLRRTSQAKDIIYLDDEFYEEWSEIEKQKELANKEWKMASDIIEKFLVKKVEAYGYKSLTKFSKQYKIFTKDGLLLNADYRAKGKLLKVKCLRDMKIFNYAHGREGDLMEPDYNNYKLFKKIEDGGYDGIIINDYAQTERFGNYGHRSIGFFKSALSDLKVVKKRESSHPKDEEWD